MIEPHSAWKAALIGAAFTLLSGSLSTAPLLWNDSTAFIQSAVETVRQGSLVLFSGVNAGYVLVLSAVLSMGWGLDVLVLLQQASWAATVGLCAFTVVTITKRSWMALPMVILGGYPGIQMYGNLLLSECIFVCCVTNATCLALLARNAISPRSKLAFAMAAIIFAMLSAVTKVQGGVVVLLIAAVGAVSIFPVGRGYFVAVCTTVVASLCVVFGANIARDASLDRTSRLFGAKTMFCSHLDIVVASQSAAQLTRETFGARSAEILDAMQQMLSAKPTVFPTLGFNADVCQHNPSFDNLGESANAHGTVGLRDWYLRAFLYAVREHPVQYIEKVLRQVVYGLKMSVPPHGLGEQWTGVPERRDIAARMLDNHVLAADLAASSSEIRAGALARLGSLANYGSRAISIVTGAALVLSIVGMCWPAYRNRSRNTATAAAIAALVWWSQALAIAASHTLDVWRYLVPVVPSAIICTLLFGCALASMTMRRASAEQSAIERNR